MTKPVISLDENLRPLPQVNLKTRLVYDASNNIRYQGSARPRSSEDDANWQISRFDYDANGNLQEIQQAPDFGFNNVWDGATGTAITDITQANPGVVTMAANPFTDGDLVIIEGVVGMIEAKFQNREDRIYKVANGDATTFELNDVDDANVNTSGFTAYTSGGTVRTPNFLEIAYT